MSLKKKWKRGSFTVELAAIMPVLLLVIFASISLCFYVHDRAWLTACACEAARTGCREKEGGREAALARGNQLMSAGLYGIHDLQISAAQKKEKIKVSIDGETNALYGVASRRLHVEAEARRLDPVGFIWSCQQLEKEE